jgi:hypothetical protein
MNKVLCMGIQIINVKKMSLMRFSYISLILFLLTSCEGCKDDPEPIPEIDKLPAATQTGAQTFGCLIDGKAWVVKGPFYLFGMYQEGILSISADQRTDKIDRGLTMDLSAQNLQPTTYLLTKLPAGRGVLSDSIEGCSYETSDEVQGTLTITSFDPSHLILSGTFEFEAYSTNCDKIVRVTEGRFDLKYAP